MKRTVFILFCFVFLSPAIIAQKGLNIKIIAAPGLSFGGNYQVYMTKPAYYPGWENMIKLLTFGYQTGLAIGYDFSTKIGVDAGLVYARQGQLYNEYAEMMVQGSLSKSFNRRVDMSSWQIPVNIYYVFYPESQISVIFTGGFYLGILSSYKDSEVFTSVNLPTYSYVAEGTTYTYTNGNRVTEGVLFQEPYKSFDAGGRIGAGLQVKISEKISLPVILTYQYGFTNIKNYDCMYQFPGPQVPEYFWDKNIDENPNRSIPYHNSFLGINVMFKFSF